MSIRMIAIDLDGTLLHDDMSISEYSRQVIRRASGAGYRIVVATGRMWDSAQKKVKSLSLGNVPLICYTGAWVMMSETGEPLLQQGLPGFTHHDPGAGVADEGHIPQGEALHLLLRRIPHAPRGHHDAVPRTGSPADHLPGILGNRHIIMKKSAIQVDGDHTNGHWNVPF